MHILLFNEYYPPDTSATAKMAAQVAEALAQRHQVTVVAGRPSYDPDEFYPFAFLRRDMRNGVTVERVGSTAYPRHQMRRRVSNYLDLPRARGSPRPRAPSGHHSRDDGPSRRGHRWRFRRAQARPAVRLQHPRPVSGHGCRRRYRASGQVGRGAGKNMHRRALKQAARVIVLGDDMRDRILAKGVAPERVVVVRDGTTLPLASPDVKRRDCANDRRRAGNPLRVSVCRLACRKSGVLRRLGHAAQGRGNSEQRKHRLRCS